MSLQVGLVGLGRMGQAIGMRLLERGWRLRVWNRTAEKAEPLRARGAELVARPEETAEPGGVVLSMLADDQAVAEIFGPRTNLLTRFGPGGVHVCLSTIASATAERMAQEHLRFGVQWVSAPVFGRPEAAAAGNLILVCSGPAEARQRVAPLLEAISRARYELGDDPRAACVAKLCGNFLIAATVEMLAEALALAQKAGIDPHAWLNAMASTLFASPIVQTYAHLLLQQRFQPVGFSLRLGIKDLRLILDEGRTRFVPLPLAELVHDRLQAAYNRGRGEWDWSAAALEVFEAAGLGPASRAG